MESDCTVNIIINDADYILHATVLSGCVDTLAAHEILGFLRPVAKYFCRVCELTSRERKLYSHNDAPLRTKETH